MARRTPDSDFDRETILRAPRDALRRCRGREGRRGDRDRDEGEQAPRRGRAAGDPRRTRGGHRPRRRHRAAAGCERHPTRQVPEAGREDLREDRAASPQEPLRQIAHHPGLEGSVIVNDVRNPRRGRDRCHHQRDRRPRRRGRDRPRDGHALGLQDAASIAKNMLTIRGERRRAPGEGRTGGRTPHERNGVYREFVRKPR